MKFRMRRPNRMMMRKIRKMKARKQKKSKSKTINKLLISNSNKQFSCSNISNNNYKTSAKLPLAAKEEEEQKDRVEEGLLQLQEFPAWPLLKVQSQGLRKAVKREQTKQEVPLILLEEFHSEMWHLHSLLFPVLWTSQRKLLPKSTVTLQP